MAAGSVCPKHGRRYDAQRSGSYRRGYTRAWKRLRDAFLQAHPHCVDPYRVHRHLVLATDVDHIVPHRGDMRLFWDASNLQALCHGCHSRKTMSGS